MIIKARIIKASLSLGERSLIWAKFLNWTQHARKKEKEAVFQFLFLKKLGSKTTPSSSDVALTLAAKELRDCWICHETRRSTRIIQKSLLLPSSSASGAFFLLFFSFSLSPSEQHQYTVTARSCQKTSCRIAFLEVEKGTKTTGFLSSRRDVLSN